MMLYQMQKRERKGEIVTINPRDFVFNTKTTDVLLQMLRTHNESSFISRLSRNSKCEYSHARKVLQKFETDV